MAIFYRKKGLQREVYHWEEDDDDDEEDDENADYMAGDDEFQGKA